MKNLDKNKCAMVYGTGNGIYIPKEEIIGVANLKESYSFMKIKFRKEIYGKT